MADIEVGYYNGTGILFGSGSTVVNNTVPCTGTGTIDTVKIGISNWAWYIDGVVVGMFYGTPDDLTSRDTGVSLGTLAPPPYVEIGGLDIDAQEGDFIGIYWSYGRIKIKNGQHLSYIVGNKFDKTQYTYKHLTYGLDLYGTGETVEIKRRFFITTYK